MPHNGIASIVTSPASPVMLKYVGSISKSPPCLVLDMGCGEGRNAFALATMGYKVTAADIDRGRLGALHATALQIPSHAISCVAVDFLSENWPFAENCFDLIVSVHFPDYRGLKSAHRYIKLGGHLYFDSVGGQGQNYLQLPEKGWVREALSPYFEFLLYEERPVGPKDRSRVAVRLLAKRNAEM